MQIHKNGSPNGNSTTHAKFEDNREHARKLRRPRLVDYLHNREDYECAHFGALGFSTRFIAERTKLRPGQIGYRLKKASISRMAFRNGESVYARLVLRNMRQVTQEKLVKHLYTVTPPRTGASAGLQRVAA